MKNRVLSKADLINDLESGCKPKKAWRIGTEHEKFAFIKKDLKPIDYKKIELLFMSLNQKYNWSKVYESEKLIALEKAGNTITLEPGGQIELSGCPVFNLFETCQQVNAHKHELQSVSENLGIGYMGIGVLPKWSRSDISIMPKSRYDIMRSYMEKVGSHGLDMMLRTCTIQANLDFDSEADMIKKMRVCLAIQPAIIALYANSPFIDGKLTNYLSYRSLIWTKTDKDRCGTLPFVFDEGFSFERYVDYLLDVPMYFVKRNKKYIDCSGRSFRDFLDGRLDKLPGEFPSWEDWNDHLTVSFPEVRLKKYIEVRGADGGPWSSVCALPAFWTGILYDQNILDEVWELIKNWSEEDRNNFYIDVAKNGLQCLSPFGEDIKLLVKKLLILSKKGLENRKVIYDKKNESIFLDPLFTVIDSKMSPAEIWKKLFLEQWGENIDRIYKVNSF